MEIEKKNEILILKENEKTKARIVLNEKIGDCVLMEERTSARTKGNYNVFTMFILHDKTFKEIPNLFQKDLNEIIDKWGTNSLFWKNQCLEISIEKNGNFFNYVLKPTKEFNEEEIKTS